MKIAQFIASSGWGGAEYVFTDLCNILSEEHEITAITLNDSAIGDRLSPSVRHVTIPKGSRYNPRLYWRLYRVLNAHSFDIVHTHSAKASRIIHFLSHFMPIRQVATKHNSRKGSIFEKIPYVTAVSKSAAEQIQQGSIVIPNGVIPKEVTPGDDRNTPFKILAIGRLDPIKGFDLLIDQAARLESDFRLDIVGDGPQREQLENLILKRGLTDKIKLPGYVDDIPERMASSDLVVISSHTEGFSLVLCEAMFYAKVLISTPVGSAVDILPEPFLVNQTCLAEKIDMIASNFQQYRSDFRSVQDANKNALNLHTTGRSYSELYSSIMESK